MRVAHKMIYDSSQYELNKTLEELDSANKLVTTGKRINSISDDPVGLTQVLNIQANLMDLDQLGRNITTGKSWLNAGETALSSASDLLSEAMTISEQMANGTYTIDQRTTAAERVDGMLRQMIDYANSQVNGQYIFSGSNTDTLPFDMDNEDNPTTVTYSGNSKAFSIKTGANSQVTVGHNGESVFSFSDLTIDSTNNIIQFVEYVNGVAGSEITAEIPSGTYTQDELAAAMRDAMNIASENSGGNIHYKVDYDESAKRFMIQDDGSRSGVHIELLWESGSSSGNSIAPYIGFDSEDIRDAMVSDTTVPSFPNTITNGTLVFQEDNGTGPRTLILNIAGTYNTGSELASALELSLDSESAASGYGINYDVFYDTSAQQFVIEEAEGTQLTHMTIVSESSSGEALSALGFSQTDPAYGKPTSNSNANWNIFNAFIDLNRYLDTDDVDGVSRSLTIMKTHFKHIETLVSKTGSNQIRLDIKENVIADLNLSYNDREAKLEDANLIDAVSQLKLKEFAYEASLSTTAKVIKMSLVDYL